MNFIKKKLILLSIFIVLIVTVVLVVYLLNSKDENGIPKRLMTYSKISKNIDSQLLSLENSNLTDDEKVNLQLKNADGLAKVHYLEKKEVTFFLDNTTGKIDETMAENVLDIKGNPLYSEYNTIVYTMQIDEVYAGEFKVGDTIEVQVNQVEEAVQPTFENKDGIIMILDNMINQNNIVRYSSGYANIYYIRNDRIYPAYDIETCLQKYINMPKDEFVGEFTTKINLLQSN